MRAACIYFTVCMDQGVDLYFQGKFPFILSHHLTWKLTLSHALAGRKFRGAVTIFLDFTVRI